MNFSEGRVMIMPLFHWLIAVAAFLVPWVRSGSASSARLGLLLGDRRAPRPPNASAPAFQVHNTL